MDEVIQKFIKEDNLMDYETADEAYSLLQNGILVETNKGLVCMSLNDAISSDLNLSVEDLRDVATKLILQQNVASKVKEKVFLKTSNLNFDSDGFSSECSDVSFTPIGGNPASLVAFTSLPTEFKTIKNDTTLVNSEAKYITLLPYPVDMKNMTQDLITSETNASSSVSDSDTCVSIKSTNNFQSQDNTEITSQNTTDVELTNIEVHKPPKRRGGWPKGRKRKPELLNLPPKAPATGYNLYLNEQRKLFKDSNLVFHEITKLIGNKWSNLSLEEKRPYLAKAEEDKRRYREELKQYRQSDAYRAYLAKKRKNRLQNNVLSESDMDATDEIDEEDNEELYCRTCDQWFHNLHNKREHLQGRQHTQSVAGEIKRELSTECLTPSSTNATLNGFDADNLSQLQTLTNSGKIESTANSVPDSIINLITNVSRRENEIKMLQNRLQETSLTQNSLCQQLSALRQRHVKLKNDLSKLKEQEREMEAKVSILWQVPSWFVITDFNTETTNDFNEHS